MYEHILIATDGGELSEHAVDQGLALAKALGSRVTLFTALSPFHVYSIESYPEGDQRAEYRRRAEARAEGFLAPARDKAQALGVACESLAIEHAYPHQAIMDAAREHGCDLIAMASHGRRGVSALLLGSETLKVLTHSNIPVLVFRR
ncbi:MAG: universal stress protein [Xanthomonadales bacterium]|nr:universal stress protein [Xanthomonadales bacterium]